MMKKAIYWVWFAVLATPAVMVFNDSAETLYINVIGILYCLLVYKYWKKLTSKNMRKYFEQLSEDQ